MESSFKRLYDVGDGRDLKGKVYILKFFIECGLYYAIFSKTCLKLVKNKETNSRFGKKEPPDTFIGILKLTLNKQTLN